MSLAIGVIIGVIVTDLAWAYRIREKAKSGFRLANWGKLYTIKEDKP